MPELRNRQEWQQLLGEWQQQARQIGAGAGVLGAASLSTLHSLAGLKEGVASTRVPSWSEAREQARRAALERGQQDYSALDVAKQVGAGALRTFGEGVERGARSYPGGDAVMDLYEKAVATAEEQGVPPAAVFGLDFLAPGPDMAIINAFHGSPHTFSRFDISKLGTGEGAQAFGRGLYFGEAPAVGQEYFTKLSQREAREISVGGVPFNEDNPVHAAALAQVEGLRLSDGGLAMPGTRAWDDAIRDREGLATYYRKQAEEARAEYRNDPEYDEETLGIRDLESSADYYKTMVDAMRNPDALPHVKRGERAGGVYEVELDVDPPDLLHWDRPLNEASPQVRAGLKKLGIDLDVDTRQTGEEIRAALEAKGLDPLSLFDQGWLDGQGRRKTLDLPPLLNEAMRYATGELSGRPLWLAPDAKTQLRRAVDKELRERASISGARGRTGQWLYNTLSKRYDSEEALTQALEDAGIPGIMFKDQMSRGRTTLGKALLNEDGTKFFPRNEVEKTVAKGAYMSGGLKPYREELERTRNRITRMREDSGLPTVGDRDLEDFDRRINTALKLEAVGAKIGDAPTTSNIVMFGDEKIKITRFHRGGLKMGEY